MTAKMFTSVYNNQLTKQSRVNPTPMEMSSTLTRQAITIPAMIPTKGPIVQTTIIAGEYIVVQLPAVYICGVRLPFFVGSTLDVGTAVADKVIVYVDAVDKMDVASRMGDKTLG